MAEIWKLDRSSPDPALIARAAELLRQSQVIAMPTDTFYGLAANPFDSAAVERVFDIKGRPKANPLLLLVDSIEMAAELSIDLPPQFYLLAKQFWPGPLTIVVKASPKLPLSVTAYTGRIGLRLPAASVPLALVQETGFPITATSANRSGEPEASTAEQVESSLGKRLPLILDGGISQVDKPSSVLKIIGESWEMVREGAISQSEIATFFDTAPYPGGSNPYQKKPASP